jgi:hypothetical protein
MGGPKGGGGTYSTSVFCIKRVVGTSIFTSSVLSMPLLLSMGKVEWESLCLKAFDDL